MILDEDHEFDYRGYRPKKEDLKNVDPKKIRPDLAEAMARHETTTDE